MKAIPFAVAAVVGAGVLGACGSGSSATGSNAPLAAPCQSGSGISAHATTNSYVIQVNVGPVETMFTQDQVAAQHPTEGEVMLRGQMSSVGGSMAGMAGMAGMGGAVTSSDRHLEAHICSKASGTPVLNANPTITLIDAASSNVSSDVPIAVMQGVGQGVTDYHYGNNVVLAPGGTYTVIVALNGEKATLHIKLPAASGSPDVSTGTSTTMGDHMGSQPGMTDTTIAGSPTTPAMNPANISQTPTTSPKVHRPPPLPQPKP